MTKLQSLITSDQLTNFIPYSLVQITRLERQGLFPKRVKLGPAKIAWITEEVSEWLHTKMMERSDV